MQVICISGKARAGKDTLAVMMRAQMELNGKRVLITHYADLLKYICKSFFGWDGNKDEHGRNLLQRIGTDIVREQYPNFWVAFIVRILKMFPDEWDYVLIPDCRFPNEIDELRLRDFGVFHIRVTRGYESCLTDAQKCHMSETALDDTIPDTIVSNDGTLVDLHNCAVDIANFFLDTEPLDEVKVYEF